MTAEKGENGMKKALILCGTIPHTLLLEKLKEKGYYTILADMNSRAPAVPFADEFVPVSAMDKEAVLGGGEKGRPGDRLLLGTGELRLLLRGREARPAASLQL